MTRNFVHMLPDMDIAFNAHDEPRIVVPHDELSQMISHARSGSMRKASENEELRNDFSARPSDMTSGRRIQEYSVSRFNEYAHQNTWVPSRLSCSPNSPARDFTEASEDNTTAYATGRLGFIYNTTAFSDVCLSPSLKGRHAFFDRPNAFSVAHDLIPIFSESKISSFQDIPFPSLWHWYGKLFSNTTSDMHLKNEELYEEEKDPVWQNKTNVLWWRGSTTGGYSREGGWRRQHRQRVIRKFSGLDKTNILREPDVNGTSEWSPERVRRSQYQHLVDVKFSGICQCDPGDCEAQQEFFDVAPFANVSSTWQHKHLLDMDGNAFSARFYGLMRSRSLVYKMAVFREWHDEWLKPWLHYIPLSLHGNEYLEVIRYFSEEGEGNELARQLASSKREWAMKALRREDMEVWFFRLLLEYGRVIQDDREEIGYT